MDQVVRGSDRAWIFEWAAEGYDPPAPSRVAVDDSPLLGRAARIGHPVLPTKFLLANFGIINLAHQLSGSRIHHGLRESREPI